MYVLWVVVTLGLGLCVPSLSNLALMQAPLRFCLPPPPDPQLFFGIALILIALSALPFRQLLRLYGFD